MASPSEPWPSPHHPLSTPTVSAAKANVSVSACTRISAPASLVFDRILRLADYHEWNTFVPKMWITTQPERIEASNADILNVGTIFKERAVMDPRRPDSVSIVQCRVADISTPSKPSDYIPESVLEQDGSYTADLSRVYRVSWCVYGGLMSKVIKTDRVTEVIIINEHECEVRSWELQGGLASFLVYLLYGTLLRDRFNDFGRDIKAVCEADYKKQSGH